MRRLMRNILAISVLCFAGCDGNGPPISPEPAATLTRTVSGTIGEVDGGPLAGAKVTTAYTSPAFTDATGAFSVAYPASVRANVITAEAAGFESRQFPFSAGAADVRLGTIRLQPTILLAELTSLAGILSPNDLPSYIGGDPYDSGDYCSRCKPLRLRVGMKQNILISLKWSGSTSLQLWAQLPNDGRLSGDVVTATAAPGESDLVLAVPASPGDTRLWVGLPPFSSSSHLDGPIAFQVTTQPASP